MPDREAAKHWIIKIQLGHRNITNYIKYELTKTLKGIYAVEAKERQGTRNDLKDIPQNSAGRSPAIETRDKLASLAGMSHDTYDRCSYIDKHGAPDQIERARRGGLSSQIH